MDMQYEVIREMEEMKRMGIYVSDEAFDQAAGCDNMEVDFGGCVISEVADYFVETFA